MVTRGDPHEGFEFVRFADSLRDTFEMIVQYVHRRLAQEGYDDVRPAHLAIFQHIRPEGSRIGELAERCQLTNQSIGSLVDHLADRGYVERRADPTNRRATLVCLTDRGWAEMGACANILAELEAKLNAAVGAPRLSTLRRRVADLQRALQELE
jgi:MarR family transcriptional regulator, temperature-dependent positive regulator of motility